MPENFSTLVRKSRVRSIDEFSFLYIIRYTQQWYEYINCKLINKSVVGGTLVEMK